MKSPHSKFPRPATALLLAVAALVPCTEARAENPFTAWAHQFNPPNAGSSPSGRSVAIDRSGFVATAGFTYSGGDKVYYINRHDPFTGENTPGWPNTYDGFVGTNEANCVVFDSAGNVIVTGQSESANGFDYYTRKYFPDGTVDWSVRMDFAGGSDQGLFVAVDSQDNVIVTGRSSNGSVSGDDIYTVKYARDTGVVLSTFRHTGPGTRPDYPT